MYLVNVDVYKNKHINEKCYIVGSGPSLNELDKNKLADGVLITLNEAVLMFPDALYTVISDTEPLEKLGPLARNVFTNWPKQVESRETVTQLYYLGPWNGYTTWYPDAGYSHNGKFGEYGFQVDLTKGYYGHRTIAYCALQLAVYMGFKEINFIGVDLGDKAELTHFNGSHNGCNDGDRPRWFKECQTLFEKGAKPFFDIHPEIKVYNCSPIRGIDCFEKKTL